MIPTVKKLEVSPKLKGVLSALVVLGVVSFVLMLQSSPVRAWANFLTNYYFWGAIGLSGVFIVALQYITASKWSIPIRRIAESFVVFIPVMAVLFVVLLFGAHHLYEWTHHEAVLHDALLSAKQSYLNLPFFTIRQFALLLLAGVCGFFLLRHSLKQDESRDPRFSKRNSYISAPFILFFGWLFSFASFDLMMSLSPHWFSTIFGIYCWVILFLAGLSTLTIFTIVLRKLGYLQLFINERHLFDLGKLLFAFVIFWAYIGFSQFMLIWYANLPEETFFYMDRLHGGWKYLSVALGVIKFIIPFFMLISQAAKKKENFLLFIAVWLLIVQWIDVYWLVFPTFFKEAPAFGWTEIAMFLSFGSLFLLSVLKLLSRIPVVAKGDPWLEEGIAHHL